MILVLQKKLDQKPKVDSREKKVTVRLLLHNSNQPHLILNFFSLVHITAKIHCIPLPVNIPFSLSIASCFSPSFCFILSFTCADIPFHSTFDLFIHLNFGLLVPVLLHTFNLLFDTISEFENKKKKKV